VHYFGTCKKNAAAQCRGHTNLAAKHVLKSEVGTAQPHSLCKYRNHVQSDWPLHFDMKNTYKFVWKNKMTALGFPTTLLECWPQVCRLKITFELLRTNSFVSTKTLSMKSFGTRFHSIRTSDQRKPNLALIKAGLSFV